MPRPRHLGPGKGGGQRWARLSAFGQAFGSRPARETRARKTPARETPARETTVNP